MIDGHDRIRFRVRKRLQQHRVKDTENGCIRPDAKDQDGQCRQSKSWVFAQRPDGKNNLMHERVVKHAAYHGHGEDSSSLSGVVDSGLSVTGTDVFVLATDRNDSVPFSTPRAWKLPFQRRTSCVEGLHPFRREPGWYRLPQIIVTMSIVRALGVREHSPMPLGAKSCILSVAGSRARKPE